MPFTHTVKLEYKAGSNLIASREKSYTSDGEANCSATVAASAVDYEVDYVLDKDGIKSICISSDKNIKIETNANDATGGQTLHVKAGVPIIWTTDNNDSNPITVDITKLFLTREGTDVAAGSANFVVSAVLDVTPVGGP